MALRQITEARQLSASHPRSAPQWAEGLVGTGPSCLFCVLTSGKPGLPTQTSRHLQKACNLPAARQRSERKDGEGEAQMLKIGACLLYSEMGSD